jgi:hypothetical protein
MGENIREAWRGMKKDLKDSFRHIKENLVAPVAGLFGVQEGANQRKGMVEDFMNDFANDEDISNLSAIVMAQNSRVDIVDISHASSKAKSGASRRIEKGRPVGNGDVSFLRKIAMPLLTRCVPCAASPHALPSRPSMPSSPCQNSRNPKRTSQTLRA